MKAGAFIRSRPSITPCGMARRLPRTRNRSKPNSLRLTGWPRLAVKSGGGTEALSDGVVVKIRLVGGDPPTFLNSSCERVFVASRRAGVGPKRGGGVSGTPTGKWSDLVTELPKLSTTATLVRVAQPFNKTSS